MNMEKFCLKWNDFHTNISSSFRDLQLSNDFSDVTLVCEDGKQIEAHRLILSACSPFFKDVFWKNKHLHPMIYMRGLKAKDLSAFVDFIYQGETNVMQEDFDGFLALADELQLQGLSRGPEGDSPTMSAVKPKQETKTKHKIPLSQIESSLMISSKEEYSEGSFEQSKETCLSLNDYDSKTTRALVTLESTDELDGQIAAMMTKIEGVQGWTCSVCEKTFKHKGNVKSHIESNHIEGASHPCNLCGKISRSRDALRKHLERHHGCNN